MVCGMASTFCADPSAYSFEEIFHFAEIQSTYEIDFFKLNSYTLIKDSGEKFNSRCSGKELFFITPL